MGAFQHVCDSLCKPGDTPSLLQVFKATDTQTGEVVAIKQMSLTGLTSDNQQAIVGEIDLLKNLRHRNIVKYIGSFKTKTHLSIILEYMEKGSLADVIRPAKFGAFPESLAAVYIAQVVLQVPQKMSR